MADYNGWKNRATWNVALWIGNDEGLYTAAVNFMNQYKGRTPYRHFVEYAGLEGVRTPDHFSFTGRDLDYKELNDMMRDLIS